MPNLVDIVEIAESLGTESIYVAADRCVVVRNRNAKCRKCANACPADAFTIEGNTVQLDKSACVSCGACSVVCPTEALIPLRPLDEELATSIADACLATEGVAVFACARIASRKVADPEKFAEVPCLARMEESVLVELAARGISHILLVDGTCSTCKYRYCIEGIEATVASANLILATVGSEIRVARSSEFPPELLIEDSSRRYGEARRGFFSQARGTAKDAAEKTVVTVLNSNKDTKVASLRERLKISETGALPQFEAKRRMNILDAMDRLGGPQVPEIETRLWGNVVIDTEKCSVCNMCTVFCPTGALKKVEEEVDKIKKTSIEFSLADCVQCRTCSDICLKHCIEVGSLISTEELFDFEPRIIQLPDAPKNKSLLSNLKR